MISEVTKMPRAVWSLEKYLELLDGTCRQIRSDKVGAIPEHLQPILTRIGVDHDRAIAMMNNPNLTIGGARQDWVTQYLESWSGQVRSWGDQRAFPVHVVWYEDLLARTTTNPGSPIRPEIRLNGSLRHHTGSLR